MPKQKGKILINEMSIKAQTMLLAIANDESVFAVKFEVLRLDWAWPVGRPKTTWLRKNDENDRILHCLKKD